MGKEWDGAPCAPVQTEQELLCAAAAALRASRYREAYALIGRAVAEDMENPKAYNLLGILYELQGDRIKALKFYRVAYYMDQTFLAPARNLDRMGDFWYRQNGAIDWGMERGGGES